MTSGGSTSPVLAVTDLEVTIDSRGGAVHAVNGVSFEVAHGEAVGIVGESGCGKSTTLRSVIGLHSARGVAQTGSIRFLGEEMLGKSQRELRRIRGKDIGFISQSPFGALNPILSVGRQFANVVRAHRAMGRSEIRELAIGALRNVGIPEPERVLDGYAHELSGGMAQRVVIAMAMIHDPQLVLADEPTTALDVTVQRQILDLMQELVHAKQRSMLIVTHDLGVVAQYCQRVVVMYEGKPVETGAVEDVFLRPTHPYTETLLRAVPGSAAAGSEATARELADYPVGSSVRDGARPRDDR